MADGSYSSGSIKASITLDTSQFQASMAQVKQEASNLNKSLNVKNDFADQLATALKKVKSELTSLIDESKMLKSIEGNIKTMAGSFDKVTPKIKNAGEQTKFFKSTLDSLKSSVFSKIGNDTNRLNANMEKLNAAAIQTKANLSNMGSTKNANMGSSFSTIRKELEALGRDGYAVPLKIGEGFTTLNNSLINSKTNIQTFISALKSAEVDSASVSSIATQLSAISKELATTQSHSVALVNTLKGMGNTGVFANLNGQIVELKGSMVSTQEGANKLIMDLRKLKPTEIEMYNTQLRAMKQQFASTGTSVEKLAGDAYRLSSAMKSFGLNVTPFVELNGQLHQIDMSQIRTTEGMARFREMLASLSPAGLMELAEQFSLIETHITNTAGRLALFKEELATINVPSFNNISTNNTPKINTNATQAILKANEANLNRVISSVNKVTTAYEFLGSKGSISIEQVDGKLVKLSSDMVRSSEGAARIRNMFSNLNTSQLVRLQNQLKSLARNTDLLRSKTALCIDTMGNLRMVNLEKTGNDMKNLGNSSDNLKNKLGNQKKSVNALDTAYGILRRTLSLIVVMFGFQMALEVFQIGKAAMDASYKIKKFGEEMNWTGQQTQKFQNEVNRLQKIYPKLDMNENAKAVIEMGRVYNLSNDEATKLLETSSVLNSAFVKEGRTTKEAALALKDYMDLGAGWTRRMSEIIPDKQELVDTGYWDGKTHDVMAQMKALDAVLKKKHYYEMAKEIYTLDEAYQALQIRLGMFIGDGLKVLTPYIIMAVQGFLKLLDAVEGIGKSLAKNPLFQAVALFASVAISVGLLSKALSILKLKVIETFASFATALTANPPLLAIAITIGIIVTAVYELGKAWGWWDDIPSMLKRVAQELGTVRGQVVAVGAALLTTVGYFAVSKWVGNANVITGAITKVVDKLKEYISINKKAKETDMTTGGINGQNGGINVPEGELQKTIGQDFRNIASQTAKAMMYLAAGMVLITEAIILINAPMLALAGTGMLFKSIEPQVRAGIEGLQLIAPVILALTPPIALIMYASETLAGVLTKTNILASVGAIVIGLGLVALAIGMLSAPMLALAGIGALTNSLQSNMERAVIGLKLMSDALLSLVPVLPIFIAAIGISAALFASVAGGAIGAAVGAVGFLALVGSIVTGMFMLGTAINMLKIPMKSIASLGSSDIDINGVKRGAESIRQVSIALQYLSTAMGSIASISISNLATTIANKFSGSGWGDLAGSMQHIDTVIKDMESVASALSKMKIPDINTDQLKKLGQVAEATKNINSAMKSMGELSNQQGEGSYKLDYSKNYLDIVKVDFVKDLKGKLESINRFMTEFNKIKIVGGTENFSEKVERIKKVGETVKQINSAMSSLAAVGNTGGVAGALKGFYYGDQSTSNKFGILFENIKSMNTFANRLKEIKVSDVNGDSLNRIKNIASHIPSIVELVKKINTSLTGDVGNGINTNNGLILIRNQLAAITNFATAISTVNTEGISGDVLTRISWLVQDVGKVVDAVKQLKDKLGEDDGGKGVDVRQKLYTLLQNVVVIKKHLNALLYNMTIPTDTNALSTFSTSVGTLTSIAKKINDLGNSLPPADQDMQLQEKLYRLLQNVMVIKRHLTVMLYNGGVTGDTSSLSTFSTGIGQITTIAKNINTLGATLPPPDQDMQLQQKLYRLLQNVMAIKRFMTVANWNLGQKGGANTGKGATSGMTQMVTDLQNAVKSLSTEVDNAVKTLSGKGKRLGSAIGDGFKAKISGMGKAMADQQRTISGAIVAANTSADNMSVHFNTTKTRVSSLSGAVKNLKGAIDDLPDSKTITISVNFKQNGNPNPNGLTGISFSLPSVPAGFGRRLKGLKGLAGLKGFSGLGSLKKFSAPSIGGSFIDAFKSVIGGMKYRHYYGTKNNGDVSDTLNSGESNCVDGALATLQLAKMYGLDGKLGTTIINGEGHAFAIIEGKIFDATAMQLLGKTKAPNVRYSASNPSKSSKDKEKPKKEVNIVVDMTDSTFYGDKDFERKIEKTFEKLSLKLLDVDKNTGV